MDVKGKLNPIQGTVTNTLAILFLWFERGLNLGQRRITQMATPDRKLRMIIAQSSYRKANRLRQSLVLAGYARDTLYEVIAANECWHVLQEQYPIHLILLSPAILAQLEKSQILETMQASFPEVALLLLPEEESSVAENSKKILPDYVLAPPVTAESLANGIVKAVENHARRMMAKRYIGQGEHALQQGSLEEAQARFQEAVRISAHDPYPCYTLGDLLAQIGHVEEAITAFIQCWEREPTNIEPVHRIVQLYLGRNDVPAAILYLEYAVQHGIALIADRIQLAVLYYEQGVEEKFYTTLRAACSADAAQASAALADQARQLRQRKGDDAAMALLQIGKEICPENTSIYAMLGDMYIAKNALREALVCYEQLTRLGEPLPESYCRLAKTYLALGFPLRAETALGKALELDPECREVREIRATIPPGWRMVTP
jgi:Flp pilus assembly protein TadD